MANSKSSPQTGPRAGGKAAKAAEADEAAIVVDGVSYKLGDLTLGELGELEDHTGLPMDAISYGSAKVIAFVVYLARRRGNPDYSLEDAQSIEIRKVVAGDGDDGVAAEVGGKAPGKKASA